MHEMEPADHEDKASERRKKEIGSFRMEIAYLFFTIFEKTVRKITFAAPAEHLPQPQKSSGISDHCSFISSF